MTSGSDLLFWGQARLTNSSALKVLSLGTPLVLGKLGQFSGLMAELRPEPLSFFAWPRMIPPKEESATFILDFLVYFQKLLGSFPRTHL